LVLLLLLLLAPLLAPILLQEVKRIRIQADVYQLKTPQAAALSAETKTDNLLNHKRTPRPN
jgi:hypothetical protein